MWSETLPKLLLAESEERFDEILAEFVKKREDYGFQDIRGGENGIDENDKRKNGNRIIWGGGWKKD